MILESIITHEDRIHFNSVFTNSSTTAKPLKLEICSGAGEWAATQALKDEGNANWITLELRHGRVYQTFVRMIMEQVNNLCVVGGDANSVMVRDFQFLSNYYFF